MADKNLCEDHLVGGGRARSERSGPFIARDNIDVALRIEDRILERVELLAEHPRSGRIGRVPGTRELVIAQTSFVAVYDLSEHEITIIRILHGAQKWPPEESRESNQGDILI